MKKEVKIAIAAIVAIWIFVMGFEIGGYAEKKKINKEAALTAPVITTTAPTTAAPTTQPTTAPTTAPSQNEPSSQAPTDAAITQLTQDQIIAKVNEHMRQVKSEQNMQANKTATVYVNVVDCSVPSVINTINSVISKVTSKLSPEENYTFSGGYAVGEGGATVTPKDVISPKNIDFSLTNQGVKSVTVEQQGENTVYTVTLIAEDTTIENSIPPHHSAAMGYLDINSLDLPINVSRGNMHYPGATITLTVGANEKVSQIKNHLPMSGDGAATILGLEGTASFEGALDETWTFTYL